MRRALDGPLLRNAISLYGTTIVTSFLGFFYWLVAARLISPHAVGIAAAVQSTAQLISMFCVLGLSTLLISELSRDSTQARTLMVTACVVVGVFTIIVGVSVAIVLQSIPSAISQGVSGPVGVVIFGLFATLTTILLVLDDACVGLLRGDLQLRRNTVFAVSKLALLPALIYAWRSRSGMELVLAWLVGLGISLFTLGLDLRKATKGQSLHLDFRSLFEKRRLMVAHHWLNVSSLAPRLILPFVVTVIVGPDANAAFTEASLVVGFVLIIPTLLSTVLYALAPGDEETLRREVRKTMRISLVVALLCAPFFLAFSGLILGIFGTKYQIATPALALLGFTAYPSSIKVHYVAISRVRGRMHQAALWTMLGAGIEVGFATAGGVLYGLTGVAVGFLAASLVEVGLFYPLVFGVIRSRHGKYLRRRRREARSNP